MAQQFNIGDRIVYPATAWFGKVYPDFAGTVVDVTKAGYLKVKFDKLAAGRIETIAPADLI